MQLNIAKEIADLQQMTVGQLRVRYARAFGETTNARNKQWMIKKIIWRLQSLAEGERIGEANHGFALQWLQLFQSEARGELMSRKTPIRLFNITRTLRQRFVLG